MLDRGTVKTIYKYLEQTIKVLDYRPRSVVLEGDGLARQYDNLQHAESNSPISRNETGKDCMEW